MQKTSVSFDGREPVETVLSKARAALQAGADTLWLACHLFERDPVSTAAILLEKHDTLRIALMAMSPNVLHPVYLAMAAATLDEFFPGRVDLCLGIGAPRDLDAAGIHDTTPLKTMRETLAACHALFSGETINLAGERFRIAGRSLSRGRCEIPLILAASGPKMLALAGEKADGVLLSAGASIPYIRWSLAQVGHAATSAKFRCSALAYSAVSDVEGDAFDNVRNVIAITLRGRHHAENLRLAGTRLDQNALDVAVSGGNMKCAQSLVGDDAVRNHSIAGTPQFLRRRIAEYHEAGLDEVVMASMRTAKQVRDVLKAANTKQPR